MSKRLEFLFTPLYDGATERKQMSLDYYMCISAKEDKNVISAHKKITLYKNSIEDNSNNSKPNERIFPSEFFPQ